MNTPPPPQAAMPHNKFEIISDSGDVVLVVEDRRFRVESATLRNISPVFAAMLAPSAWKEGQNLSIMNPPEVHLPDDSADAIKSICELAAAPGSRRVTVAEFYLAARELQKYMMDDHPAIVDVMRLDNMKSMTLETLAHLLAASIILQRDELFCRITTHLVYFHRACFIDDISSDIFSNIEGFSEADAFRLLSRLTIRRMELSYELLVLIVTSVRRPVWRDPWYEPPIFLGNFQRGVERRLRDATIPLAATYDYVSDLDQIDDDDFMGFTKLKKPEWRLPAIRRLQAIRNRGGIHLNGEYMNLDEHGV